ncbi:MAG: DNA polymerase III subunit delta [Muribaculaceae bacterium]|nr:DNA polymerase III subunit delta [Muribaculaceae bacterium]
MRFSDIPGHEDIKDRLRLMVSEGRVPHALLFEGPSGTAKFMLARAFAQYLHCTDRHDDDSCGKCPSCLQHQSFRHIDTVYSFPVIKKDNKPTISDDYRQEFVEFMSEGPFMDFNRWPVKLNNPNKRPAIYVEEGNELIRRMVYTAHASKFKIVLMWLPERMQEDAANKMLKLIEEPTSDTLFLMASDNSRALLPTIYSRVQRIKVKRYANHEVERYLISENGLAPETACDIAAVAEGDINRALEIAEIAHNDNSDTAATNSLAMFIKLMRLAYQRDIASLKVWSNDVASLKREGILRFLDYCARMLRENFILNLGVSGLNHMTTPEHNFSANFARFVNERNVLKLFDEFNLASRDVAANGNPKIILFDLAISVILLLKQ